MTTTEAEREGQRALCILGMHRSGTSLTTRVFNLLGVDLGPEKRLLSAGAFNPTGLWEHAGFVAVNNAILRRLGGSWHEPPDLPDGWETEQRFEPLVDRARSVIARDFATAGLWGWKDPRTCVTLPFWKKTLEQDARFAICLRDPRHVMRSLEVRDGFSASKSLHLWLTYTRLALAGTHGQQRTFAFYEDLVKDWATEVPRLARFIGCEEQASDPRVRASVREFIDRGLSKGQARRAKPKPSERRMNGSLEIACSLYETLKADGASSAGDLDGRAQAALSLLSGPLAAEKRRAAREFRRNVRLLRGELADHVPAGCTLALVDDDVLAGHVEVPDRYVVSLVARDGASWGRPSTDEHAIDEVERAREHGVSFVVFAWPAMWWLSHYRGLTDYLSATYSCVSESERAVMFDLTGC